MLEEVEWRLPRHARSVGRARALLRDQAVAWKLPDEVTETAVLLLSELMTNAYRHAKVSLGREIWTRCILESDRLRVSVADANDTLPTPREASLDDESGRGLTLVTALADTWGSEPRPPGIGKTVWFELSAKPASAPSPTASARAGSTAGVSAEPPRHGTRPS
ncbi:ATP-binding protein [Streptomyces sp. NL15-2K]|uniref:ATP-binding protein n=1 Tax=Streptomyces sp. NL15-2K TaxID=376149 RepID=UPI000F55A26C|nr:ATP-binding protein [Streptomyces sp. NL15-2K]